MLKLVENGIFPITKDEFGNDLKDLPQTGLLRPGTIQGEGKLAGIPVLFLRTSGCNLRCSWQLPDGQISICDTPYSSFYTESMLTLEVEKIAAILRHNQQNISHLVISGGEPMLQHMELLKLIRLLKEEFPWHISIESNATIYSPELAEVVDFFSLSPKLPNSAPTLDKLKNTPWESFHRTEAQHRTRSHQPAVIQKFINISNINPDKDFQLKFVVGQSSDLLEIKNLLEQLEHWLPSDVLLMPLGKNQEELAKTCGLVLDACIENGWRYAPRMHIELFGDKPGV